MRVPRERNFLAAINVHPDMTTTHFQLGAGVWPSAYMPSVAVIGTRVRAEGSVRPRDRS